MGKQCFCARKAERIPCPLPSAHPHPLLATGPCFPLSLLPICPFAQCASHQCPPCSCPVNPASASPVHGITLLPVRGLLPHLCAFPGPSLTRCGAPSTLGSVHFPPSAPSHPSSPPRAQTLPFLPLPSFTALGCCQWSDFSFLFPLLPTLTSPSFLKATMLPASSP